MITKLAASIAVLAFIFSASQATPHEASPSRDGAGTESAAPEMFTAGEVRSSGSVTVESGKMTYDATAGRMIVRPKGWDDAASPEGGNGKIGAADGPPIASMFYVGYFRRDIDARARPVTFIYNGGPGSSSVWLHLGAFGPMRIAAAGNSHMPAAPYRMVENGYSLLDASDLVFIDAPGTGFSRIEGKEKEKAFWGVDQDAYAFSSFIVQFLTKYGRWNSPKYLFGESYGTSRSAVLINQLETERRVDFNGVILLSQILNFALSPDGPETSPGDDLPYELELPTFAATAWYHHRLDRQPPDLSSLLEEVEQFAMGEYATALHQGAELPRARFDAIAAKLHEYTGLPAGYIKKANLRITGMQFGHELQSSADIITSRLDTRFSGPAMNPLGESSEYDPQPAAIASAYVAAFNDYTRRTLHYATDKIYDPQNEIWRYWEFRRQSAGTPEPTTRGVNVMPDLANAMKYDPELKVCVNEGYFDLATPFYEGRYEMSHLPIPQKLQANIEYHYYMSGHMVYADEASLKQLHDNVAAFIKTNSRARN